MANQQEEKQTDRGPVWVVGAGAIGAVTLTVVYVRFRTGFQVGTVTRNVRTGRASADERLAKLLRHLASLKSRVGRIENEAFNAKREVVELEGQLQELGKEGDSHER